MRKSTKLTVAGLSIFAAAAIYVSSLAPANAIVFPGPGVCVYYSDARMKTAVGARGTGCCGSVINWGVTSAYKKCQNIDCTDQVCPN